MRRRLIDSATECLHDVGYSASTTVEILRRAGASRGAMLHHFPTKVDLMLATAAHIVALQTAWYDEQLALVEDEAERFVAITTITWRALREPTGMALLEILMATRSDPELGRRFPPVAREIERVQQRGMWMLAKQAGVTDRLAVRTMTDALLAGIRGLSIQRLFAEDTGITDAALEMLVQWQRTWIRQWLPAPNA